MTDTHTTTHIPDEAVQAAVDKWFEMYSGGAIPLPDHTRRMREAITAALPHLSAPCAVEVVKLDWDGLVGFVGSFSYVVAPPSFTKGWRVWGKISDKSASIGGVLITTTAANEEEAKAAAQADFERRILSCVVTKPVYVAAVREQCAQIAEDFRDKHWIAHDIKIGIFPNRSEAGIAIADAIRALSPAEPAQGKQWQPTHRHVKRGTKYQLIGVGKIQTENWVDGITIKPTLTAEGRLEITSDQIDMQEVAIYRGDDGQLWARPVAEFNDGRFEALPAAPTPEVGE